MESILEFFRFTPFSIRDLVDIALVSFIIYRFLLLMRGTRGVQMTFGIVMLLLLFWVTRFYQLASVQWLLSNVLTYIVIAIIVLYQHELRRGLAGIGKTSIWGHRRKSKDAFEEIVLAVTTLASKKVGALIVIERDIGLRNYSESGITLDALLSYDLLVTIFSPYTPLHDGAVIAHQNRIIAAACFLPLTQDPYLSKELGTRHRAAIGITEETDAVAIIVSEETGTISLAREGKISRRLEGERLRRAIQKAVEGHADAEPSNLIKQHREA